MTSPPCPHCRAPAPLVGDVAHAWDCPNANARPQRHDWDSLRQRGRLHIPDTTFTPLPPLASLAPDERARLVAVARECERGWEALAAKKMRSVAA